MHDRSKRQFHLAIVFTYYTQVKNLLNITTGIYHLLLQ